MERSYKKVAFSSMFVPAYEALLKHYVSYLVIVLLSMIPILVMFFTGGYESLNILEASSKGSLDMGALLNQLTHIGIISLVVYAVGLIIYPFVIGANNLVALAHFKQVDMSTGEVFAKVAKQYLKVLGATLVVGFIILVPITIVCGLAFAGAYTSAGDPITIIGILLMTVLAILVVYILMALKTAFVIPIMLNDEIGIIDSVKASFNFSAKSRFWSVFVNMLLMLCVLIAVGTFGKVFELIPLVGIFLSQLVTIVAGVIYRNFMAIYYVEALIVPEAETPELITL